METDRIKRMILREKLRGECQRHLRAQELTAYGEFMSALRMSGGIDHPKREVIDTIKKWFQIPEWRHQAEIRRVASDERLTLIANTLSDDVTSEDWIEEGYDHSKPGTSSMICPIISDRDLVLKVIERRLKMNGVDVVSDDDEKTEVPNSTSECAEKDSIILAAKILNPLEPFVSTAEPEIVKEALATETVSPYPHQRTFVSNLELDDDSSSENRKKSRHDCWRDVSASPDITSLSDAAKRKNCTLQELGSRLSHSSIPDLVRIKRKAEREKLIKERVEKVNMRAGGKEEVSSRTLIRDEEDGRTRRETSAASSSSSCFSPSEALEQFQAVFTANPNPQPSRGRGLSRVRGRGRSQTSARGRGRGRGRPPSTSLVDNPRPWSPPPQHLFPPDAVLADLNPVSVSKPKLGRGLKAKSNGEDIKKRTAYKRKKSNFEHFPIDNNFHQTSPGDLKQSQSMAQLGDQLKTNHSYEQPFPHENRQYYDSHNYDGHGHGQLYNRTSSSQRRQPQLPHDHPHRHHHHHYQQDPETPSKIRQKTKHTVIIQDPHESLPALPNSSPNFTDYNETNPRHLHPNASTSACPQQQSMSSVIVRTPFVTHSGNTLHKMATPMSRTHVTITQNPKSIYYSAKGHVSHYEGQQDYNSSAQSPFNPPTISNNLTHKKRTQNLAAATTYTPQADSYSSTQGNISELGQQFYPAQAPPCSASTGTPSCVTATASSLAVRNRQTYDSKLTVPVPPSNPPLAAVTSLARTPPLQSNSTPPVVHQRKAQPHILATSKMQRNAAAAAAATSTSGTNISNSGATTPGSPASSICTSSLTLNTPGGISTSSSYQTPNSTITSFVTAASSGAIGKPNVPLTSSHSANLTRAPGPNIIFVQKNPNPSLPGQVTITPVNQHGAAVVKGPGKAVILRRANNSNLMILDLQNKQLMSPVSQLLNSKSSNLSQVANQIVGGSTPTRKIIQTAGAKMLPPPTAISTSSEASTNFPRTTQIFPTQSGTSVAISVGTPSQTNLTTMTSQITLNQSKPPMAIRPVGPSSSTVPLVEAKCTSQISGPGHMQRYSGLDLLGLKSSAVAAAASLIHPPNQNCAPENGESEVSPALNHSNILTSRDTASDGEINSSLLSCPEIMERSPPPVNNEEGNQQSVFRISETAEQFQPVTSSKTRISVTLSDSTSPEAGYYCGGRVPSILNQALVSNKSMNRSLSRQMLLNSQSMGVGADSEDNEAHDGEETVQNTFATSPEFASKQYRGGIQEDRNRCEEEDQFDSDDEDDGDGDIELIDLADS